MANIYFMSQLPSLDGINENVALPITEERFLELCQRFLDKKAQHEISKLTLTPPREYEKSSEIVNEYISQDISRLMHDNGIFLFSSKEKAKNTSRSGYETQMGRFAIDFYEQFKKLGGKVI